MLPTFAGSALHQHHLGVEEHGGEEGANVLVTVSTDNGHGARGGDMVGAQNAGRLQTVHENVPVCELTAALSIDLFTCV